MVDNGLIYFAEHATLAGMGRKRTELALSAAQAAELRRRLRSVTDPRELERLQTLARATRGEHTLDDLARLTGRARATIQLWLDKFRRGGLAGLLERDTPPGSTSPIAGATVQAQLQAGLKAGRWHTAREVAAWLRDTHGIVRARKSIYYWLAKTQPHTGAAVPPPRLEPRLARRPRLRKRGAGSGV